MTRGEADRPAVSVLVPIYNAERYLAQCLEALKGQTLKNLEFVCVNDGSTDGSAAILRGYAEGDDRFRIIEKKNSGYGASLNQALGCARGAYVGIIEPDDFPSRRMFKRLHRMAVRYDCDLVKCNYFEHASGEDRPNMNLKGYPYRKMFDPADHPDIIRTIPSIWTGLYRRDMLEREGIRFRETPGASFQDTSFVLKSWFAAQRCALIRTPLLHYRIDNPSSSVKTSNKVFTVCEELVESEGFLHARPNRRSCFAPWLHVDKWGKYRWNYDRIAEGMRLSFMCQVRSEYEIAVEKGELRLDLFNEGDRAAVSLMLERGEAEFLAAYPNGF